MWYVHRVTCDSKLGIVIAAYNAEKFLAKTLESIRQITYSNYVCVVVDDGSIDATRGIADSFVKQDSRFRLVTIENSGPCVARNIGYKHLDDDAEYIVFTDADDVIFPDTYKSFIGLLERCSDFVAVHGLGTFIDEFDHVDQSGMFERIGLARQKLRHGRIVDSSSDEATSFESLVLSSTVFPPGLVVHRRTILERSGLFDPGSRYAEDWDLLLRVSRFGDLGFVPRPVLHYRRHSNNVGASPHVPGACKSVWLKTYYSKDNTLEHSGLLEVAFRAKNLHDLSIYCNGLVKKSTTRQRLRNIRGVFGCICRLAKGKP